MLRDVCSTLGWKYGTTLGSDIRDAKVCRGLSRLFDTMRYAIRCVPLNSCYLCTEQTRLSQTWQAKLQQTVLRQTNTQPLLHLWRPRWCLEYALILHSICQS